MVDARNDYWMPMDVYIGGIEHAVLHLLYARFWTKAMRDMGLLHFDEPFVRMMNQGFLLNHIYFTRNAKGGKEFVPPIEVKPTLDAQGHIVGGTAADGTAVEYGGVGKMGKTERNGVDPQALIDQYGADTARLFVMFVGGPEDASVWSDSGVEGSSRFLRRLWETCADLDADLAKYKDDPSVVLAGKLREVRREVHLILKQALYDYERMQYNTVVSACMKLLNLANQPALRAVVQATTEKQAQAHIARTRVRKELIGILLRVLYPACPHITQTLWNELGFDKAVGPLLDAPIPEVDESALVRDEIELVLQVNGKTRGAVRVSASADKAAIEAAAQAAPEVAKFGDGKPVRKVVVVPGRLVNVVCA
jgi:leucyl-tRNA synthetase